MARAAHAAALAGVTRLAEVTRLDQIGIPVFQAIRPFGRTVSVHQGKALSAKQAMIGALMEAVETDHAEAFPAAFEGERWTGPYEALPAAERAPCSRISPGDAAALHGRTSPSLGWPPTGWRGRAASGPQWTRFASTSAIWATGDWIVPATVWSPVSITRERRRRPSWN